MDDHPLYTKNRKELIEERLDEYGYVFCEECEESNSGIECHHIVFRSECAIPEKVHDKINLILLCPKCHHGKFHAVKSTRNKYVQERNLNEWFGRNVEVIK
jgi:5-methylcytosine-specific restriction endonuclease McrA